MAKEWYAGDRGKEGKKESGSHLRVEREKIGSKHKATPWKMGSGDVKVSTFEDQETRKF